MANFASSINSIEAVGYFLLSETWDVGWGQADFSPQIFMHYLC